MTEYGDTHKERTRELTETGTSVRHRSFDAAGNQTGTKGILTLLYEALEPEADHAEASGD